MARVHLFDLTEGAPEWPSGKKWRWHERVAYIFPEGWEQVRQRVVLTPGECTLLHALLGHCDWGNRCLVTCAHLGRQLGRHRSTVLRTLRRLETAQLVCVDVAPGHRDQVIVLSPHLVWKGRPWHVARARENFDATIRLRQLPTAGTDTCASLPHAPARPAEPPPGSHTRNGASPFSHYPPRNGVGSP